MGIFAARPLERSTIIGRTRALTIKGDSRFVKFANLTGRELLTKEVKTGIKDENYFLGNVYGGAAMASMACALIAGSEVDIPSSLAFLAIFGLSLAQMHNYSFDELSHIRGGWGSVGRTQGNISH